VGSISRRVRRAHGNHNSIHTKETSAARPIRGKTPRFGPNSPKARLQVQVGRAEERKKNCSEITLPLGPDPCWSGLGFPASNIKGSGREKFLHLPSYAAVAQERDASQRLHPPQLSRHSLTRRDPSTPLAVDTSDTKGAVDRGKKSHGPARHECVRE
jgi:hypothetical protein